MNTPTALAAADSLVAWCNELARSTDRLDRIGRATRALCATAFPLPSILSAPLLGEGLSSVPAQVPVLGMPETPCPVDETTPRRPASRRRAGEPAPVVCAPADPGLKGPPSRRGADPMTDCEPARARVAAGEVARLLREAVGSRIGADPDGLLDVLRKPPRAGRQASAGLLDRVRDRAERRSAGEPERQAMAGDGSGSGAAAGGAGEHAVPAGRARRRQVAEGRAGALTGQQPGAGRSDDGGPGQMGGGDRTPGLGQKRTGTGDRTPGGGTGQPGGGRSGWPGNVSSRRGSVSGRSGDERLERSSSRLAQPGGDPSAQSSGDRPGQLGAGRLAQSGDDGLPDGRAVGRSTEPVGAGGVNAGWSVHRESPAAEARVGGPDVLPRAWPDEEPRVERPAGGWDDADVERVLERVLGDAARRHGIEV